MSTQNTYIIQDEQSPLLAPPLYQVAPNAPSLFIYKENGILIEIVAVGLNGSGWVTRSGNVVTPNYALPEYIYYILTREYKTAYSNTVSQMAYEERTTESNYYKAQRTFSFLQYQWFARLNSRLGCIQFILILWTVILLAGIAGSLILMHHEGLF